MEAVAMEKKVKEQERFVITRNEEGIKDDTQPYLVIRNLLNELVSVMNETDFKLETIEDVEGCISNGPTTYVKELALTKVDQKVIRNFFGFIPDHGEMLKRAPVPASVAKADRIADQIHESLTDLQTSHVTLSDFDFENQRFSIKPEITQRIIDAKTKYAASKKEEALVRRLKEMVSQFNELRADLIEYAPGLYQDSWTHPEVLFTWNPLSKTYEPDLKRVANIFSLKAS